MRIVSTRRLREEERGVTLLIVTVGMLTLLTMAVLAMDVVSLYVGKDPSPRGCGRSRIGWSAGVGTFGHNFRPRHPPANLSLQWKRRRGRFVGTGRCSS